MFADLYSRVLKVPTSIIDKIKFYIISKICRNDGEIASRQSYRIL